MIYKITISVLGSNFYPEQAANHAVGGFIVKDIHAPSDIRPQIGDRYDFGSISFWHQNEFSTEDRVANYETDIVDFLVTNQRLFSDQGADEFHLFYEIYYSEGQCNFEILNSKLIKMMSSMHISLPVSVYRLDVDELADWEREINERWHGAD